MKSSFRKSVLAIVALATLAVTGAVAPAAAQGWGGHDRGRWERHDGRGGWDRGGWDRGGWNHGGWRHHGWNRGGWDRGGWDRGGWDRGWDGPRRHWRADCWVEDRPVRVFTPWGPRLRYEPQRVCR